MIETVVWILVIIVSAICVAAILANFMSEQLARSALFEQALVVERLSLMAVRSLLVGFIKSRESICSQFDLRLCALVLNR